MFDWISDLISGIGNAISSALSGVWETVSGSIWGVFMNWLYTSVYNALADFFTMMTELGANLFDLSWVQAALKFFSLFGWGLFIAGLAVAIFDIAIEYQSMGRINIKRQILPFFIRASCRKPFHGRTGAALPLCGQFAEHLCQRPRRRGCRYECQL